jgi:ureidoglycolate lyase
MRVVSLELETATKENIAPFGALINIDAEQAAHPLAFYEGSVRFYTPVTFISDEDTQLTIASVDRRKMEVKWLERHFKHTQAFLPLQGRPFVVVMTPPSEDDGPDVSKAKAILFDGTCGFMMHVGTWHEFPFALLDRTELVVVLRGEATKSLMKDVAHDGEGHGPDLDKRDIQARLDVLIKVTN